MAANQQLTWNETQRQTTYKFKLYRQFGAEPRTLHDFRRRILTHPRPRGRFRGLGRQSDPPYRIHYDRFSTDGPRTSRHIATQTRLWLERQLRPSQLDCERILGWGGNGVAALFYLTPVQGSARDYFVVKCSLDPNHDPMLMREKDLTAVCPCPFHAFPFPLSSPNCGPRRGELQANRYLVPG